MDFLCIAIEFTRAMASTVGDLHIHLVRILIYWRLGGMLVESHFSIAWD